MRRPQVGAEVRTAIRFVWQQNLRLFVLVSCSGRVGFCAVLASLGL